jgi:NADH-quinone oxidoreductase subunit N
MTAAPYWEIFKALGAETVVVLGALAALTVDLLRGHSLPAPTRMKRVGMVAIIGLLGAVVPLWLQLGSGSHVFLAGTLIADDLSRVFKLVIIGLTVATALISMDYDIGRHVGEYFATMLFGAIGMMVLVATEELLTIFVALELTSISLYILTAFHKGALRSQEAAVKYFMFGAMSSAFLLFGLSYLYGLTGATSLRAIAGGTAPISPLMSVGLLFVVIGLGFKVAVVPFHLWAPDAYEGAPTPVTAFIATGSKVASFFVLTKVMVIGFAGMEGLAFWGEVSAGWTLLLAVTATLSMVLGNFVAIVQYNVKRLLAYSSIAHAGYIFVGLIAATGVSKESGIASVFFYIIVYGLTNLGAFGVVAVLASRAGGDNMENFNGMARRAPFLSLLMLIFLLSLAGIPPLGGFFGKFYLFAAAVQRDAVNFGLLWLVIIGILTTAVSLYYYLVLLKHIYVHEPADTAPITTPGYVNVALALIALGVIAMGIFPETLLSLLANLVVGL